MYKAYMGSIIEPIIKSVITFKEYENKSSFNFRV